MRALWAAAGVLLDELSGPVLVLALVGAGDGLVVVDTLPADLAP